MEEVRLYKVYFAVTIGESEVIVMHIIAARSYDEANRYGNRTAAEENAWICGYDENRVQKLLGIIDNGDEDDIADATAALEEVSESIGKVWRYESMSVYSTVFYDKIQYRIRLQQSEDYE